MIVKHIVMWKLKEFAEGADRETNALRVKEKLEGLIGKVPGLLHLEVGIDFLGSEQSADVVLYSELESRAALEAYQAHADHQAVVPFMKAVAAARTVVDYEVQPS